MVYFYLAWVEWYSFALADFWHVECTDCSFESNDLLS